MKTVLYLHSKLHNSGGAIDKLRRFFPTVNIVPIYFPENVQVDEKQISGSEYVVTHSKVKEFVKNFDFSSVVAIHAGFMTGDKVTFIKSAPQSIKVIWAIPGGDLYNRYLRYMGYPLVYNEKKSFLKFFGGILRGFTRRQEFYYLMKRCSAIICAHCDYKLIQKYNRSGYTTPEHIYSTAYSMEKVMGPLYGLPFEKHEGNSLIVGNSASFTNNHLYVLEQLSKTDLADCKVSVIMSYGHSSPAYRKAVQEKYAAKFRGNLNMISDYLPLEKYNELLMSATHFIYGNWRQEAVGNILTALYLGGKVFLSEKNPLLEAFLGQGLKIFCLEKIGDDFLSPLSDEDKQKNRERVSTLYNDSRGQLLLKGLSPYYS